MANPTASDSGTNSARAVPCMAKDGMNTARMQSIARSRGTAVSMLPSRTARATDSCFAICVWMFSTSTVASSTKMPTASARPPSVIRLMDWPENQSATSRRDQREGIFNTTTITLRQSRKKQQHH